jgi:hypothetical protein
MSPADRARLAIHNRADAEALLMRISDSMVALVKIFEDETKLIKAGRLREASMLVEEKTALASDYLRLIEMMKANADFIGGELPSLVDDLRRAHAAFRDILQLNLRVVATAQSVAEGVMRGAAEQAIRRDAPGGYGAGGRMNAQKIDRPVMLSRSS